MNGSRLKLQTGWRNKMDIMELLRSRVSDEQVDGCKLFDKKLGER